MTRFIRSSDLSPKRTASRRGELAFLAENDGRIFLDFDGTVEKEAVWKSESPRHPERGPKPRRVSKLRVGLIAGLSLGILALIGFSLFQSPEYGIPATMPQPEKIHQSDFRQPSRTEAVGSVSEASDVPKSCRTFQGCCGANLPGVSFAQQRDLPIAAASHGVVDACVTLCNDIRTYLAPNEKVPERIETEKSEPKPPVASLEKVLDQLQALEAQRKGCELALELMKNGNSVFSGFMPEPAGGGVESLKVFQAKIAELEIKRKSLATRFTPQSNELRVVNEEMAAVRETMRECLTEYIAFLNRKKDYLAATKLKLEGKEKSVAGRSEEEKQFPMGKHEPVPLPQLNPSSFPQDLPAQGSRNPFITSARETAWDAVCSAVAGIEALARNAGNSIANFLVEDIPLTVDSDLNEVSGGYPSAVQPLTSGGGRFAKGQSADNHNAGLVKMAALDKPVTNRPAQVGPRKYQTPDCAKQSMNMD
jgi:hypothetical protein